MKDIYIYKYDAAGNFSGCGQIGSKDEILAGSTTKVPPNTKFGDSPVFDGTDWISVRNEQGIAYDALSDIEKQWLNISREDIYKAYEAERQYASAIAKKVAEEKIAIYKSISYNNG